jgi:drug/metabolite transporter (DMT)-like permease
LLSVVLWGFSPIGTRYMVGTDHAALPAMAFTGMRYGIAALVFAPLLWGARHWSKRDWALGAVCGVIGVTGFNLPAALGQRTVSAGLTGLLDGAEPLMIVIFSSLMHRRLPSRWTMFASVLGLGGIVLLAQGSGPALGDPAGIALVLFGAMLWALYCVMVPILINRRGALSSTAVTMLFGALPLLAAGLPGTPGLLHIITGFQWGLLAVMVLTTSVISMLCWNAGSAVLGAEQAGWFLYLLPVVSLIGGALLLGEPVKTVELVGGALILVSVYLSQR